MPPEPRPVTVITGAGRGIGAATAELLAQRGHDLVPGDVGTRPPLTSSSRPHRTSGR